MKTIKRLRGEETQVEGPREMGGQNVTLWVIRGETERGVRPGKVAGAWQRRSQHHHPSAHYGIQQSPTS